MEVARRLFCTVVALLPVSANAQAAFISDDKQKPESKPVQLFTFNDKTFQLEITGDKNHLPKNVLDALKKYNEEVLPKRKLAIGPRDDKEVEPPLSPSDSVEIISEDEEFIKLGFVYVLKASEVDTKGGNIYRNMFLRRYKEPKTNVIKDGIYIKGLHKSKVIPINVPVVVLDDKTAYFVDHKKAWGCPSLLEI